MSNPVSGIKTLLERNQERTFSDAQQAIFELQHEDFAEIVNLLAEHAGYIAKIEVPKLQALLDAALDEAQQRDGAAADIPVASDALHATDDSHQAWHQTVLKRLNLAARRDGQPARELYARVAGRLATTTTSHNSQRRATESLLDLLRAASPPAHWRIDDTLLATGDALVDRHRSKAQAQARFRVTHEVSSWDLDPAFDALVAGLELYKAARDVVEDEIKRPLPAFNLTASRGGAGRSAPESVEPPAPFPGTGPRGM